MRIVSVTDEAGGKVFELEDSIVSDTCWVNIKDQDVFARQENVDVLRKLLLDGVFYVGVDDWRGKLYYVTLIKGQDWSIVEPRLRCAFEALPHVPWT